jgi:hypothetical protein
VSLLPTVIFTDDLDHDDWLTNRVLVREHANDLSSYYAPMV